MSSVIAFDRTLSHPGRPLVEHLKGVERLALRWLGEGLHSKVPEGFDRLVSLMAVCHDLGKATGYFQEYLASGGIKKNRLARHSLIGARAGCNLSKIEGLKIGGWRAVIPQTVVGLLINAHHGDLPSYQNMNLISPDVDLQVSALDGDGLAAWLNRMGYKHEPRAAGLFSDLRRGMPSKITREEARSAYFWILYAYSLLIGADKIDAATGGMGEPVRADLPRDAALCYLATHARHADPLAALRENLRNEVMATLESNLDKPLYTLTAPTGTGKTLLALSAASRMRAYDEDRSGKRRRIIYCLPFTSVIDQNTDVYRKAIEASGMQAVESRLLAHHHLVDMRYRDDEGRVSDDDLGSLFVENWSSEIVVTTFYQLLHTIFGNQNSLLKKFHRIPGSILILDEVQNIPRKYWELVEAAFSILTGEMGCRILLMTATQPGLLQRTEGVCELLGDHSAYFCRMARVEVENRTGSVVAAQELMDTVSKEIEEDAEAGRLFIVNTKSRARSFYETLRRRFPEMEIVFLSGFVTPKDRLDRVRRLTSGDCSGKIVVSTQVVEAGVDLSMDIVHRDLAPLDSMIQASGRCNRHGGKAKGRVVFWRIAEEENGREDASLYDSILLKETLKVLNGEDRFSEGRFLDMSKAYFEGVWRQAAGGSCLNWLDDLGFEDMGKNFRLIEERYPSQRLFVIQNEDDERLWLRYESLKALGPFERRAAFSVFKRDFSERIISVPMKGRRTEPLLPLGGSFLMADGQYDPEMGYVPSNDGGGTWCV